MLRNLSLLALAASAQAQIPRVLLSTTRPYVEDRLEFNVLFSECVSAPDDMDDLFTVNGVSVDRRRGCDPVNDHDDQFFRCRIDIDDDASGPITVVFPANQISATNGVRNNADSNILTFNQLNDVVGTWTSVPVPAPGGIIVPSATITFVFTITSAHPVYWNGDTPVRIRQDGEGLTIEEQTIGPTQWTFRVTGTPGDEPVEARLNSDVARDFENNRNDRMEIDRIIRISDVPVTAQPTAEPEPTPEPTARPTPIPVAGDVDCVISEYGDFTECSGCFRFTSTFERIGGVQMGFAEILVAPQGNGAPCPPLMLPRRCGQLCPEPDASRPYSGETGNECANCELTEGDDGICRCDLGCEARGDCCQGYYQNQCCSTAPNCLQEDEAFILRETGLPWQPLQCPEDMCSSSATLKYDGQGSYQCYCDATCIIDNTCCGGTEARNAACA